VLCGLVSCICFICEGKWLIVPVYTLETPIHQPHSYAAFEHPVVVTHESERIVSQISKICQSCFGSLLICNYPRDMVRRNQMRQDHHLTRIAVVSISIALRVDYFECRKKTL